MKLPIKLGALCLSLLGLALFMPAHTHAQSFPVTSFDNSIATLASLAGAPQTYQTPTLHIAMITDWSDAQVEVQSPVYYGYLVFSSELIDVTPTITTGTVAGVMTVNTDAAQTPFDSAILGVADSVYLLTTYSWR
jgi:hypothetical protein